MADRLAEQDWSYSRFPAVVWREPPTKAVRDYAEHLRERAQALYIEIPKTHIRHRINQENKEILSLVLLVREYTGKPHLKELAP